MVVAVNYCIKVMRHLFISGKMTQRTIKIKIWSTVQRNETIVGVMQKRNFNCSVTSAESMTMDYRRHCYLE